MYYAALTATSIVINKESAGLWINDDATGWWGVWVTAGRGTQPVNSYNLRPSNRYLFPYCVPYYDVNEDSGVKYNYSSVGFGGADFEFKKFLRFAVGGVQYGGGGVGWALCALCWKFYWNICLHGSVAFNLLLFISFRLIYFFTFAYLLNLITPQIPMQTCCC